MEPAFKRPRGAEAAASSSADVYAQLPEHVSVWCMDDYDPRKLCQVNVSLLVSAGTRLGTQIKYDAPEVDEETGKQFYRLTMTRGMLSTFIRALEHHELTLSKNVSYSEAVATLQYEGVTFDASQEVHSLLQDWL